MITAPGTLNNIFYHGISKIYPVDKILLEEKISPVTLLKRRIKKNGLWKVIGQLLFQLFIYRIILWNSKKRKRTILQTYNLQEDVPPLEKIIPVPSVNSKEAQELLVKLQPDLILISGTRIISEKTLSAVKAVWINIHVGITPMYRGVHGGYWALANQDPDRCGVTIHLVDKGIDTGSILAQGTIHPTSEDNFSTYPYLQYARGIELVGEVLENYFKGNLTTSNTPGASNLWYHPTAWEYLRNRILKRVK